MEYMDLAIAGIVFGSSMIGLIGGIVLIVVALRTRSLRKTEEHTERLALIERGRSVPGRSHRWGDMMGATRLRPDGEPRKDTP